jgi:geranylgeranyl diphosphate synthase type II
MTPGALLQYLDARRRLVDAALARCLPQSPPVLDAAMRYSLLGGGKRLRPLLAIASAEAVGSNGDEARRLTMPAACALEMIHTYSLIHDDLPAMDDDSLRRGQPTSHVRFGEGMAILAGDGLLTEAFALLAREPATDDVTIVSRKVATMGLIAEAAGACGMVGGQAIDLHAARPHHAPATPITPAIVATEAGPSAGSQAGSVGAASSDSAGADVLGVVFDADTLRDMHARKTGALIRAAALAGATMAGGNAAERAAISAYATELGLAFQIVDDVLDVEGTADALGKTAGKDAAAGKPTYPALFGLDESKRLAREAVERACAALDAEGVGGRLKEIAAWVVERTS